MNRKADLSLKIGKLYLDNPIMTGSGTFGFGREYEDFIDISKLGAVVVKGLTLEPRKGNKRPRIAETPSGMLNSIGLENPGVKHFIQEELPYLKKKGVKVIANIAGNTIEEYCKMAKILNKTECDAIEMNISCPNVKKGGVAFGTDKDIVYKITSEVRKCYDKTLIVKLSPNVTNIKEIAINAEKGGADSISLINTLLGMAIDINTRRPKLKNNVGGLSGPAIKPIALRMVWQVSQVVNIPIIGMGGITSLEDIIEFMLAGANAVAIGTGNFINPAITIELIEELESYLINNEINSINELVGKIRTY
ncbi:dihydroorotate dehydrogenase [Caldisalinibacter kiritimatiensis]|uniref:Dihydroorotate dehydrogenase n=1 Tax=Caldisalinibacter kiritimatiensis TaxID=1304284 RepID=R1AXB1_9FIRM|nr:dihydroorotate dehydrogenase [Caldisalinibacter kiritimatiensis]EOD01302.1 Dihydroorotate dehydrogenase, catalytic subunit [Caldisalinibacter kiritimatiensis]